MVGRIILILMLFFVSVSTVEAADYYVSPTGNDSNSGASTSTPFATFVRAWESIQPGDTMYLMDGTYYQTLAPPLNGAPNPAINTNDYVTYPLDHPERIKNYVKVKALNDGKAIIDGQFQRYVVSLGWEGTGYWNKGHYFVIEGLVGKNSKGAVFQISSAKNLVIRRNSGYNANPHGNEHVFNFYPAGTEAIPSNILVEDNVGVGSGRKMFLVFASYNNVILSRNFAAWQFWTGKDWCGSPWPQTDGVEIYPARQADQPNIPNNTYLENNINFGLTVNNGIGFSPNTGGRYGNHIMGNIALGAGMRWNNGTKQFVNTMFDGSPLIDISEGNCRINTTSMPTSCVTWGSQCLLKQDHNRSGLVFGPFESPYFENNEFRHNFAAQNGASGLSVGTWATGSNNNFLSDTTLVNNGIGNPLPKIGGATAPNYDTSSADISQFSSVTNIKVGQIWNGTNPSPGSGARLQYRYQRGQLTNQSLWPWPMEERIKREFADPSLFQADGVQGRVWTNFSVTQEVCEKILKPNGAVSTCGSSGLPPPPPTATTSPPAGGKSGDANGDNLVDGRDYIVWLTHYGQNVSGVNNGNFNGDTKVDGLDYVVWLTGYGR